MGKPNAQALSWTEYIGPGSKPGEVKHLSIQRKRKRIDSLSSGERNGNSPNQTDLSGWGRRASM